MTTWEIKVEAKGTARSIVTPELLRLRLTLLESRRDQGAKAEREYLMRLLAKREK